jgi:hypothetical protein
MTIPLHDSAIQFYLCGKALGPKLPGAGFSPIPPRQPLSMRELTMGPKVGTHKKTEHASIPFQQSTLPLTQPLLILEDRI